MSLKLAVVVATTQPTKTRRWWESWRRNSVGSWQAVVVWGGRTSPYWHAGNVAEVAQGLAGLVGDGDHVLAAEAWGVVPAYLRGIEVAKGLGADVVACFHDDLGILESGWDYRVRQLFEDYPECLLAGFSGARGAGRGDIYREPYDPYQLARQDFFSNMRDAEAHGRRVTEVRRMACCDGFSLIGRVDFMLRSFRRLSQLGVVHHAYDTALGAFCRREGGEAWFLPVACHHEGGQTAVGDPRYEEWARRLHPEGDRRIWLDAHAALYEELRGVLPFEVRA